MQPDFVAHMSLSSLNQMAVNDLGAFRLLAQDEVAFAKVVDVLTPSIFRRANSILGNEANAEDSTQNTFLKIAQHLPGFKGNSQFTTWVFRIATNEALQMRRKKGGNYDARFTSLDEGSMNGEGEHLAYQIPSKDRNGFDNMNATERAELLGKAMKTLSAAQRTAITLKDIEGMQINEIAEALQISEGAVKSNLSRGRHALADSCLFRMAGITKTARVSSKRRQPKQKKPQIVEQEVSASPPMPMQATAELSAPAL